MLNRLKESTLIKALQNIYALLDKKQRRQGIFLLFLLFTNAGIDVIGLGAIYPLIDAALNPGLIQEKYYLKCLYDIINVNDSTAFILVLSCIVLVILILKNTLILSIVYIQTRYSYQVALGLIQQMFRYYYEQGFLFLKDETAGMQLFDIREAPYYFAGAYFMQTLFVLTEFVIIIFIIFILILYQPHVIILFVGIVLPIFLGLYFSVRTKVKNIGVQSKTSEINSIGILLEGIRAYVDVKLSNQEKRFLNEFTFHESKLIRLTTKERVYKNIPRQIYDIVLVLGVIVILLAAWLIEDSGTVLTTTLGIFALSAYRLIPALGKIFGALVVIKNVTPKINSLLILSKHKPPEFTIIERLPLKQGIIFDNISFSYPDSTDVVILKNISFQIKKGETIGFIGVSGAGKTTLIHILLRLIQEDSGCIEVDGKPLNEGLNASFQKNIGYVQQDVFIKDGTLSENIAFGETVAELDKLRLDKAIQEAILTDFVTQHSLGINMVLGENGVKLSGGQKQRVGIARALYKQSEILVFDEITSALDMETESAIVETMTQLARTDKTIIIIAHRITTLSSCDRIYELDKGQIVRAIGYRELFKEKMIFN